MANVTQKTLKMIQKLKATVIKLLEAKTSERIKPRTEEENVIYRRVLQEAEKEEREITAILKGADSNQPKAVVKNRPSVKSKGKPIVNRRGRPQASRPRARNKPPEEPL
jgi:hypothetical protein